MIPHLVNSLDNNRIVSHHIRSWSETLRFKYSEYNLAFCGFTSLTTNFCFSCNRRRSLLDNVSCFLEKSFEAISRMSTPTPNVTLVWNSYFEGTCFQKVSTGST